MHAIAWNAFRASQRLPARRACRIIAGVRRPLPTTRKFHCSAISYQVPEEPSTGTGVPIDAQGKSLENDGTSEAAEHPGTESEAAVKDGEQPQTTRWKKIRTDYGSAVNRAKRSQKSNTGVPPVVLPSWFLKRNVRLAGELEARFVAVTNLSKIGDIGDSLKWNNDHGDTQKDAKSETEDKGTEKDSKDIATESNNKITVEGILEELNKPGKLKELESKWELRSKESDSDPSSTESQNKDVEQLDTLGATDESSSKVASESPKDQNSSVKGLNHDTPRDLADLDMYSLEHYQFAEILATLTADLVIPAPTDIDIKNIIKPPTLLLCPKDGGLFFLDNVVDEVAKELHTDLLRLDSQDLAEIVGRYIGENVAWTSKKTTALLGYDSQDAAGRMEVIDNEVYDTPKASEEEEDFEKPRPRPSKQTNGLSPKARKLLPVFSNTLKDILSALNPKNGSSSVHVTDIPISGTTPFQFPQPPSSTGSRPTPGSENWIEFKINTAVEALLDAVSKKRKESTGGPAADGSATTASNGLIVHVRDFKELLETRAGSALISKLEEVVKKRWQAGEKIILVGTTSSPNHISDYSKADIQDLQSQLSENKHRTIVVAPNHSRDNDKFNADERSYMRGVNLRHVEDMTTQLSGYPVETLENHVHTLKSSLLSDLEDSVWPLHKVHRIATTMVGCATYDSVSSKHTGQSPPETIDFEKFSRALDMISSSDEIKFTWAKEERQQLEEGEIDVESKGQTKDDTDAKATKDRIKKLKEKCNYHEKKLLNGVIYPNNIKTAFSDVRAPAETIEALKTLTSLSLIRPEAFSYGVLATDKIPGLLLYGPPGTGKTMLAKAVAKESGATVLDVSGADLFNLYVGEGEKNVRALFSLAKKLTPCVVFIDEADAIFGSRGGDSSKRSSHRELINQFLREWDGMNDMSAFIMVATNRPFDLDDAVLRRLPRRLLVDLPTEKDREAILKIHLSSELLDDTVSLQKIAKDTPFYSGSDLKNICVAAALACVREENDAAAKYVGEEPYVYPPKRILGKRHFDRALQEISASISEDMGTLTAVRKFDEKYGDRKGRKKKRASLGFGGVVETEKDSEAGRVRKIEEGA